ncbi:plasmid maintenance system killer [Corallococcus sp. AB050B]|nr:plasmid maintenance system killer [Corallococcus sp. AB050B]
MRFEFESKKLEALYLNEEGARKYPRPVVGSFFEVMAAIDAATSTQDLLKLKGLNFEKLKGNRKGQCSLRLNDQWRLIVKVGTENGKQCLRIVEIADYH